MKYELPEYLNFKNNPKYKKTMTVAGEYEIFFYRRPDKTLFAKEITFKNDFETSHTLLTKFYANNGETIKYLINTNEKHEISFFTPSHRIIETYGFWDASVLTDKDDFKKVICIAGDYAVQDGKKIQLPLNLDWVYQILVYGESLPAVQHMHNDDEDILAQAE